MSESLRVLLVTADFPPDINGVGDYTERLADHLATGGCDVTVLTRKLEGVDDRHRAYRVRREVQDWSAASLPSMLDVAHKFDVAHVQYPGVADGRGMLLNRLPSALAKERQTHAKTVVTFHEFRAMRSRWRARASLLFRGLDAAVLVDPEDQPLTSRWSRFVRPLSGPPTFDVIPIAPNVQRVTADRGNRDAWRARLGLGHDEVGLLYFGILYPHKGVDLLLDAAIELKRRGHPVRPVVIGNFDRESDWRRAIEPRLQSESVSWVQNATATEVSQAMHACDIAMLAYESGAGPNRSSLLTALSHELPVITTNGPATPAEFREEVRLRYIPPGSLGAAVDALEQVLTVPAERDRLVRVAGRAAEAFSWSGVAERHVKLYRRLLDR